VPSSHEEGTMVNDEVIYHRGWSGSRHSKNHFYHSHQRFIFAISEILFVWHTSLKFPIMAVLHNRISQKELKELLYQEKEPRTTLSFYQYFHIDNPQAFRDDLYK